MKRVPRSTRLARRSWLPGAGFLLFARAEPRHHEGSDRTADRQCRKSLPLAFEREHQRGQPSGDEDQRPQRYVP